MKRMKPVLALLFAAMFCTASAQPLWMRYPAISPDGSTIVFAYKGDLYTVDAAGGAARMLTTDASFDSRPVWSPDGAVVAYVSDRYGNFDIFTIASGGGKPCRVTTHSAAEIPGAFSADGKYIYFTAQIADPARSAMFPKGTLTELYRIPVQGGRPEQVLATPAEEVCLLPDGFLYQDCKGVEDAWRKHHTSSVTRDLWRYDASSGTHTRLTDFAGEDRQPRLAPDGRTVYFLSERSGTFNVWAFQLDNPSQVRQVTRMKRHPVRFLSVARDGTLCFGYNGEIYTCRDGASPQKVRIEITGQALDDQRRTINVTGGGGGAVSPDGKQIAFISRGNVFVTSAEYVTTRQITDTPEAESGVCFAPDNRTLVYASERDGHWNIYSASIVRDEDPNFPNAALIEEKALFKSDGIDRWQPKYSPDGKRLAFVEERSRLMVMDIASGKTHQITDGSQMYASGGYIDYSWSPDGKWLALSYTGNRHDPYTDIGIVSADGKGQVINLTNSGYTDSSPRWVLGGNALLFGSERYGMRSHASWGSLRDVMIVFLNQAAWDRAHLSKEELEILKDSEKKASHKKDSAAGQDIEIDLRGIEDRIERLTRYSSELQDAAIDKQGDRLYYIASFNGVTSLWETDLHDGSTKQVQRLDGGGSLVWDGKQETLFVLGGSRISKMKSGGRELTSVRASADMELDPAAERQYMFDHVYRQEKLRFYTVDMHGADWDGLYKDYARFLPHINNNYDFAEMLSEWLGELNVSHTGGRYTHSAPAGSAATAELGLLFDGSHTGDGLLIAEVVEKGPFDKSFSKAEPGDIVEAIDGTPIKAGEDYFPLLDRRAGRKTLVSLRRPSDGSTWQEMVVPVSRSAFQALLYSRWVKRRAEDVDRLSGGRLGYVHIEAMGDPSFRTVYSDILGRYNDREGIVIDTRFNGGGRLHEDVEVLFSGHKYLTQVVRGNEACDMPSRRWNKPSIMLTCEANYSNAHGTPWVYRYSGLGKIVGMPVPGTMTSVSWERLQDPSLVFGIPIIGYRTEQGTYLENSQLEPDIMVANTPETLAEGRDLQLETAVKVLLEDIDAAK